MKLTDLEPRQIVDADIVIGGQSVHDADRTGMGISFLCPCCRRVRLGVFYANPIDGKPPSDNGLLWQRTGETWETLSLSPSINAEASGHWHGNIQGGSLT